LRNEILGFITGIISDSLGGGAAGLEWALIIMTGGGLIGTALFWIGSKSYPADMERVKHFVLQAER
jgi:hypothetical protein